MCISGDVDFFLNVIVVGAKVGGSSDLYGLGLFKRDDAAVEGAANMLSVGKLALAVELNALEDSKLDTVLVASMSDTIREEFGATHNLSQLGVECKALAYKPVPVSIHLSADDEVKLFQKEDLGYIALLLLVRWFHKALDQVFAY